MAKDEQQTLAAAFRALHRTPPILLLPNAWDAMSARIFAAAGFAAIATTSAGVAWALGYPDGERAPWPEVVAATRRIARVVSLPVTADIEAGYGATPDEVAAHVSDIIAAGAVGINLEDGVALPTPALRDSADAAARIRAARAAADRSGVALVINARSDVYYRGAGDETARFAETLRRCKAYLAAGADCVYPFGLRDPKIIADLVEAVAAPVNVTGRAGMPDLAALERLGVARVTLATAPALMAMALTRQIADALRSTGSFAALDPALKHPDAQKLFSRT